MRTLNNGATALPRRLRNRHGAALIWVAMLLVAFIGIVALALDWGYAYWTSQKLQNAADAAALAGAREVYFNQNEARARAIAIAAANEAGGDPIQLNANETNDPAGDVILGHYDPGTRQFTATTDANDTNAVAVNARRTADSLNGPLDLIWGQFIGQDTTQITRWAIAYADGGPTYADIIALNPDDPLSFYMYGNGYLDLGESGTIQVDSDHLDGTMFQGTSLTLVAGNVNMVAGDYETRGKPELSQVELNPNSPYVADPLAELPEPIPGTPMSPSVITGVRTYDPGYYPGGLDLKDSDVVFLNPGVYILDTGFYINGHAQLTGYGVMFFIRQGAIHHNGSGNVYLTPPAMDDDDTTLYDGIQFFQARDNTEMAFFNGTGLMTGSTVDDPSTPDIDESTAGCGQLYFPNASVELGGTGDMYFTGLIADKVVIFGDGRKTVTSGYEGDKGGDRIWLVE